MDSVAARPEGNDGAQVDDKTVASGGLSRRDRDILAFERKWWQFAGLKEQAIKEMFDLSPTRYYQVLNNVIDNPAALAEDPLRSVGCADCGPPGRRPARRDAWASKPEAGWVRDSLPLAESASTLHPAADLVQCASAPCRR